MPLLNLSPSRGGKSSGKLRNKSGTYKSASPLSVQRKDLDMSISSIRLPPINASSRNARTGLKPFIK